MLNDPLVGTWRKVAINGHALTEGTDILCLRADGAGSTQVIWRGKPHDVLSKRWRRVNEVYLRMDSILPKDSVPGQREDFVIPGGPQQILEVTPTRLKLQDRIRMPTNADKETRFAMVKRWLEEGEPMLPGAVYEYERITPEANWPRTPRRLMHRHLPR